MNTWSSQGIEGLSATSAATAIGLVQAALEEETMNCAVCEERFHTELESVEIAAVPVAAETIEEEVVVEPTVEEKHVEEAQVVEVPTVEIEEVTVQEVVVPEVKTPVAADVPQEDDDDYDPELDDDDDENAFGKAGIGQKFMIFWGKAKRKIEKVGDRTDAMIDNISE